MALHWLLHLFRLHLDYLAPFSLASCAVSCIFFACILCREGSPPDTSVFCISGLAQENFIPSFYAPPGPAQSTRPAQHLHPRRVQIDHFLGSICACDFESIWGLFWNEVLE